MKKCLTIAFLFFLLHHTSAQKAADFKIGLGYPLMSNLNSMPSAELKVSSLPTLFIERPFSFLVDRQEKISINPGFQFTFLQEELIQGTQSTGKTIDLNHLSFSGYAKFIYKQEIARRSKAFVYLGALTGLHFFSRSIGEENIRSNSSGSEQTTDINKSGKDFFNMVYFGPLIGFQPDAKITNRHKISFEVSYLPGFITANNDKANGIHFSIQLGIFN